jgi:hypothetical protein
MFILRCSATVGFTRYAISTTIERTFSSGCTIEGYTSEAVSSSREEFLRSSPTSEVSIGDRHGKCEDVESVII